MATLLTDTTETLLPDNRVVGERLWLSSHELERATGWESRPEGLCRGSMCVPIPPGREREFLRGDQVDVAAFSRHLSQPLAHSADGAAWVLGTSAADRAAALHAPDFTLPDRSGNCTRSRTIAARRCCRSPGPRGEAAVATWAWTLSRGATR